MTLFQEGECDALLFSPMGRFPVFNFGFVLYISCSSAWGLRCLPVRVCLTTLSFVCLYFDVASTLSCFLHYTFNVLCSMIYSRCLLLKSNLLKILPVQRSSHNFVMLVLFLHPSLGHLTFQDIFFASSYMKLPHRPPPVYCSSSPIFITSVPLLPPVSPSSPSSASFSLPPSIHPFSTRA